MFYLSARCSFEEVSMWPKIIFLYKYILKYEKCSRNKVSEYDFRIVNYNVVSKLPAVAERTLVLNLEQSAMIKWKDGVVT